MWGLLSDVPPQHDDQCLADDEQDWYEQDWYSEVREDEGECLQELVHDSESEAQGWHEPDGASEASAEAAQDGRFYMNSLVSFQAIPKILEPVNERDG